MGEGQELARERPRGRRLVARRVSGSIASLLFLAFVCSPRASAAFSLLGGERAEGEPTRTAAALGKIGLLGSWLSEIHPSGLEGEIQFGYEWNRRRTSFRGGTESRFERMNFTEKLRLLNRWFVFDPRLASLTTGGTIGFFQEQFSFDGKDQGEQGNLLGYDLTGTFLQGKPYTLTAFTSRGTETLTREFASSSEVLRESSGATLTLREVVPFDSTLLVRRDRIAQDLRFGSIVDQREELRTSASYAGTWLGEVTDLDLGYEFNDVDERTFQGLDYQTHEGRFAHLFYFGPYLEKSISSRWNLFQRAGTTDSTHAQANEDLRIEHTDTISTGYRYNFSLLSVQGFQTVSHAGDVNLQHRLFESLTTTLNAQARSSDFRNGRTLGYGGNGQLDYTKEIWLGGRFVAGAGLFYRIDDQEVPEGELLVVGERHVFAASQRFFLDNPRVDRSSLVITNESRTIVFQESFDYVLRDIGEETEVERVASGRIEEGQAVLVDYAFVTAPSLRFASRGIQSNVGLDYDWFLLYYRRSQSTQDLLSGAGSEFLDDVSEDNVGLQLRWSRPWASAESRNEYRNYRSRRLDFVSPSFSQSFSLLPRDDLSVNLNMDESFFRFRNPERERSTFTGRFGVFWRPFSLVFVDLGLNYLQFQDDLAPTERFVGGGLRLRATYGRLSLSPFVDYNRRDVGSGRSRDVRAGITVSRSLF